MARKLTPFSLRVGLGASLVFSLLVIAESINSKGSRSLTVANFAAFVCVPLAAILWVRAGDAKDSHTLMMYDFYFVPSVCVELLVVFEAAAIACHIGGRSMLLAFVASCIVALLVNFKLIRFVDATAKVKSN